MRKCVAAKSGRVISGPYILLHRSARRSRRSRDNFRQAGVSHKVTEKELSQSSPRESVSGCMFFGSTRTVAKLEKRA
jgi:hypothetical protein